MHTVHNGATAHRKHTAQKRPSLVARNLIIWMSSGIMVLFLIVQLLYPGDRLLPFVTIDGMALGGKKHSHAVTMLDSAYAQQTVAIYMGSEQKPTTSPKLSAADIKISNAARMEKLKYPWYLRIIPTSILWAGLKSTPVPTPTFGNRLDDYVEKYVMPGCRQAPVDASLKADGEKLVVVPAKKGGQCEMDDVIHRIKSIRPTLREQAKITVARKEIDATISDDVAKDVSKTLMTRLQKGVPVAVGNETVTVLPADVYSWLDFASKDNRSIGVTVNTERARPWFDAHIMPKVTIKPGVSQITTKDFTIVSQVVGSEGQALDLGATVASIQSVVDGSSEQATAATKVVPPTEQYTRTYSASDAGISALMANYAKDHPGMYGISMTELDGKKRRGEYRGNEQFVTASTYKLLVAYSLMKQIDAGRQSWESNAACFNKMISYSDNPCSEAFLSSLGLKTVSNDIQAIGLKNSTFMKSGGPYTTANDMALLLGMIATGQNFSSTNQQRLIAALKANVYRNGIPAGVSGAVADKVGFMDGLLHDAAIVYSPNGTYVLAIMTNGSSWANIADLAGQLDKLHAQ